ncbi:MAG: prepilin-type N-terminal cleavage/methylation domain-containing protein [Candidatus Berkelbacteria bacterium]|nr:prepilin-type N-terminal cleavage/methylation domain-containing protein [Candidatus Berkelbacteria bacterium]
MTLKLTKSVENPEPSRRGMTLIELLISLAIIALMTTVALPLFSSYQKRNRLDSDTQLLSGLFNYERALNLSPDYSTRANPTKNFFEIRFTNAGGKWSAALYSAVSGSTNFIDRVDFAGGENLSFKINETNPTGGGDFAVDISGKPPTETASCFLISGQKTAQSCSNSLSITIALSTASSNPGNSKIVQIQNSSNGNLYAVSVL